MVGVEGHTLRGAVRGHVTLTRANTKCNKKTVFPKSESPVESVNVNEIFSCFSTTEGNNLICY